MPHDKKWFKAGKVIHVDDKMQKGYSYKLTYSIGTHLKDGGYDEDGNPIRYENFEPYYTPQQMLSMGVYECRYVTDCAQEYPAQWFKNAKMVAPGDPPDPSRNYFGVKSRQSLQVWREKGWIGFHPLDKDVRGWGQWYFRYFLGRRIPAVDKVQVKRWAAFARHYGQLKKHARGQPEKRLAQRQACLQWAWHATV